MKAFDYANRPEDYNFAATIRAADREIRGVTCRLWLPKRMTDRIRMVFYPSQRQESFFHRTKPMSVGGLVKGFSGDNTAISASEVWLTEVGTRSFGANRHVTEVEADPIDLRVFRQTSGHASKKKFKATISYVFSHSPHELAGAAIHTHYPDGRVRVKHIRRFVITLRNKRRLTFENESHREDTAEGERTWSDLRAREITTSTRRGLAEFDSESLSDIDDFLTLVTFSSRYPNACVGVESFSESGDHLRFFRKNRTVPPPWRQETIESVVDLSDFEKFIRLTYPRFVKSGDSGPHELLRHALELMTPRIDRTVEAEFTTLFAALESIVLWHRRLAGMEWIIEDEKTWRSLREHIGDSLKTHPVLQHDKERRRLIREKLGELRRVPFSRAFEDLCATRKVVLTDLWPVVGRQGDMSLSEVRNHIVHGSHLEWAQLLGLGDAALHLRWTIERIVLAVLGWPLEKTRVRPDWLAKNMTAMIELEQARAAMRRLPEQPDSP